MYHAGMALLQDYENINNCGPGPSVTCVYVCCCRAMITSLLNVTPTILLHKKAPKHILNTTLRSSGDVVLLSPAPISNTPQGGFNQSQRCFRSHTVTTLCRGQCVSVVCPHTPQTSRISVRHVTCEYVWRCWRLTEMNWERGIISLPSVMV